MLPSTVVIGIGAVAAAGALYLVLRLHFGFVDQLARNLRLGAVSLKADDVVDATTEHILAETSSYTEREQLMERIRQLKEARGQLAPIDDLEAPPPVALDAVDGEPPDGDVASAHRDAPLHGETPTEKTRRFAEAVAGLVSDDPARIRRVLHGEFMDVRLVPYLIPLLGHNEVASDARMELRWLVPRVIGQLTDALLDPELDLKARQRIPGVLEVSYNPRVVRAGVRICSGSRRTSSASIR